MLSGKIEEQMGSEVVSADCFLPLKSSNGYLCSLLLVCTLGSNYAAQTCPQQTLLLKIIMTLGNIISKVKKK